MVFSSIEFLIFFAIVFVTLLVAESKPVIGKVAESHIHRFRHIFLLVASYIFYGWWDWRFCFLMLSLTFIAYISAKNISEEKFTAFFKILGIAFPLVILGFFKYFNFFLESFSNVFGIENMGTLNIILPVGISFYTFQSMSYTIDVVRKDIKSEGFLNVALYVAFFPQLVAGPVVKASDYIPQLHEDRRITKENVISGAQIFVFGLFKKVVFADHLSVFVDDVFSKPEAFHSFSVVLAVISYSIQIYFDFSGYSDMAVGCAKCIGYDFSRNFNMPYISKNPSEFWKRWHISLSTWLQQYLYISLGGNRKGTARTYINLLLTMVLGGLWHGASWNFVLWGALHGILLCIHKIFKRIRKGKKGNAFSNALSVFGTYIMVCLSWVLFRAEDFSTAFAVYKKMFIWSNGILQIYTWAIISVVVVITATAIAVVAAKKKNEITVNGFYPILNPEKMSHQIIFITALGLIVIFAYTGNNPFIYFQF